MDEASIIRIYGKVAATSNAKRKTRWNMILCPTVEETYRGKQTLGLRIMGRTRLRVAGS